MRSLLERSGMVFPTFESKRSENLFQTSFLLHHLFQLVHHLLAHLQIWVSQLGKRADEWGIKEVIVAICAWQPKKSTEIATILEKSEKYVLRKFLTPLRSEGRIHYTIPDMANHPDQAYSVQKNKEA